METYWLTHLRLNRALWFGGLVQLRKHRRVPFLHVWAQVWGASWDLDCPSANIAFSLLCWNVSEVLPHCTLHPAWVHAYAAHATLSLSPVGDSEWAEEAGQYPCRFILWARRRKSSSLMNLRKNGRRHEEVVLFFYEQDTTASPPIQMQANWQWKHAEDTQRKKIKI